MATLEIGIDAACNPCKTEWPDGAATPYWVPIGRRSRTRTPPVLAWASAVYLNLGGRSFTLPFFVKKNSHPAVWSVVGESPLV